MEEFTYKSISDSIKLMREKAHTVDCVVSHTRTSEGFASIELRIDGSVALKFNNNEYGDDYKKIVLRVAELLAHVANTTCVLPDG